MKKKLGCGCLGLVFCLFMGVTAISMGVGALYPPLNKIAGPLVCPGGQMVPSTHVEQDFEDGTIISVSWECLDDSTKERTPLSLFPIALISGTVYGFLLFLPVFLLVLVMPTRPTPPPGPAPPPRPGS